MNKVRRSMVTITLFTFPFTLIHLISSSFYQISTGSAWLPGRVEVATGTDSEATSTILSAIPTFLGNNYRNFYGIGPIPSKLKVIWKVYLGSGRTWVKGGFKVWSGCGWTGQPLIVEENERPYILIGAYDHHLRKIDGLNGKVIWKYKFDDVIKGTGTIYRGKEDLIILQGSRRGNSCTLASKIVPSFRAISYSSGKELWRMNIPRTESYSRDVDGSALVLGRIAYLGAENGIFYIIDISDNYPKILKQIKLYNKKDIVRHGHNLVIESSPALCGDKIIVTAGSGHVFGIDKNSWEIVWDFYIGSDLNGSPVVTKEGYILVSVEKQYIPGQGGVFMLDPRKKPSEAVKWYFPVKNRRFADWEGGVIGSPAINDSYNNGEKPALAAFSAIDGNLYVVLRNELSKEKARGPNLEGPYPMPKKVFQCNIGGSISTPIFCGDEGRDWIIAAGYNGVYLFRIDYKGGIKFALIDHFAPGVSFEATPVVWKGRIYIGSRNGWFYCLGDK
jgi:outer membrane protein assembly factor BamB